MTIQHIITAITTKGMPALANAFVRAIACVAGMDMTRGMHGAYRSSGKPSSKLFTSLGNARFAGNGVNAGSYRYDSGGSA